MARKFAVTKVSATFANVRFDGGDGETVATINADNSRVVPSGRHAFSAEELESLAKECDVFVSAVKKEAAEKAAKEAAEEG